MLLRDDRGAFQIGDSVVNIDEMHRYYNRIGKVISIDTILYTKHEDHSIKPYVRGKRIYVRLKILYSDGKHCTSLSEFIRKI